MNLLSIVALGFLLGMRHATDADHVVAITAIAAQNRKLTQSAWIGILWGIGHTFTIMTVGGGMILFGLIIPTRIGLAMEFTVALMLTLLGILNLTGVPGRTVEVYDVESDTWTARPQPWIVSRTRPLVVGLVHGLAGSAAVALMVMATIRTPRWALVYLFLFGVGTLVGMMLITMVLSAPFQFADRVQYLSHWLGVASGVISLGFGLFLIYNIGFLGGLFTAHPTWIPR